MCIEGKKKPPPSLPSDQSQFRGNVLDLEKVSGKRLLVILVSLVLRSSFKNLHEFKMVKTIGETNLQAEGAVKVFSGY